MPGRNYSEERLRKMCPERELMHENGLSRKKIGSVLLSTRMRGSLLGVNVFRREGKGMSYHFRVELS